MKKGSQNFKMLADNTLEIKKKGGGTICQMLLEISQRRKPVWLNNTTMEAI